MSRGPGYWQRAALTLLEDKELKFAQIAGSLGATTLSQRSALRRALDRLVAVGRLGKRSVPKYYLGYPRQIVWFRSGRGA